MKYFIIVFVLFITNAYAVCESSYDINQPDENGNTAIFKAVNSQEVANCILMGADLNQKNNQGHTPLSSLLYRYHQVSAQKYKPKSLRYKATDKFWDIKESVNILLLHGHPLPTNQKFEKKNFIDWLGALIENTPLGDASLYNLRAIRIQFKNLIGEQLEIQEDELYNENRKAEPLFNWDSEGQASSINH